MADEYCSRASYFFNIFSEHVIAEGWNFRYIQAQLDEYRPSLEYLDWAVNVRVGSATYARITELHNMFPRLRAFGH